MLITIYMVLSVLLVLTGSLLSQSVMSLQTAELQLSKVKAFHLAEAGIDAALGQWKAQAFSVSRCEEIDDTLHPGRAPVSMAQGQYAVTTTLVDGSCRIRALGTMGLDQCVEVLVSPANPEFPGQLVGFKSVLVGRGASVEGTLAIGSEEQVRGDPFRNFEGAYFRTHSELHSPPEIAGRLVIPDTANPYQLIGAGGLTLTGRNIDSVPHQERWRNKMSPVLGVPADEVFDRIDTISSDSFQDFFAHAEEMVVVPQGLDCSQPLVVGNRDTVELSGSTHCFSSITVRGSGTLIVPPKSKIYVKSEEAGRYAVSIGHRAEIYAQNAEGEPMPGGFDLRVADGRPVVFRGGSDTFGTVIAPHATVMIGYNTDTFADEGLVGDADDSGSGDGDDGGVSDSEDDEGSSVSRIVGNRIVVRARASVLLGETVDEIENPDAGNIKLWRQSAVTDCSTP
ncbi:MAG: hypothetical protein COV75_03605 [Candidatus Omnitrophica bacterium CG11_big_fil_rev_8_21_14_0_20_63_9]|nr:MAG: hypothetical protein COV75_03605 [Candidatus Omnitrophica bacterium CG11_big_fil_rev_8_21_14_0_20_63_9]